MADDCYPAVTIFVSVQESALAGVAPPVADRLTASTGSKLAFAAYVTLAAALGTVAIMSNGEGNPALPWSETKRGRTA